MLLIHSVLTTE